MPSDIAAKLAPSGTLRAGINASNMLLVTGKTAAGDPVGVAPDMAAALADKLGVKLKLLPYDRPNLVAEAGSRGEWDVAFIGAEPARAVTIAFSPAYCGIEATYLVRNDSPYRHADEMDRKGVRMIVSAGTAFGLWLEANIKQAEVLTVKGSDDASGRFMDEKLDAWADLKPRLLVDVKTIPGTRILDGAFTIIQQAVGVPRANEATVPYLHDFIEDAKASGLVARLIEKHKVVGLSVAPKA